MSLSYSSSVVFSPDAHAGEDEVEATDTTVFESDAIKSSQQVKKNSQLNAFSSNHLRVSLIGLPNSGKSCLFNLLTSEYGKDRSPEDVSIFSTTDVHVRSSDLSDQRLDWLVTRYKSKKKSPLTITYIDNPALVPGSHWGRALGNSFLSKTRTADILVFLLRAFVDEGVTSYIEIIDPVEELRLLEQELMISDMQQLEDILNEFEKFALRSDETMERTFELETMIKIWETLAGRSRPTFGEKNHAANDSRERENWSRFCGGIPIRYGTWDSHEMAFIARLDLLTTKDVVVLVNMSARDYLRPTNQWIPRVEEYLSIPHPRHIEGGTGTRDWSKENSQDFFDEDGELLPKLTPIQGGAVVAAISIEFEKALDKLYSEQTEQYMNTYLLINPKHLGILRVTKNNFNSIFVSKLLEGAKLIRFYTSNEAETRTWIVLDGTSALRAAAIISVELERRFSFADIMGYDDFVQNEGDIDVMRAEFKLRSQGKRYLICDGDIVDIKVFDERSHHTKR